MQRTSVLESNTSLQTWMSLLLLSQERSQTTGKSRNFPGASREMQSKDKRQTEIPDPDRQRTQRTTARYAYLKQKPLEL